MNQWLAGFVYHIDMGWEIFIASGSIAIFIAVLTVGLHAVSAATANPVESLKCE